ncbi:hypothetical protein G8A07_10660 [Roseateles sp. DAIF2]|uniref:hypothetical protein n=1 Tax=Roseateles sp. DAIF2 TaxID=2714952 RepID=UPI0018A26E0D|nr:hypothetical protein [Roseateles sp. DAIF2]QPF73330.1 hypothetical protein G8A07_10660 [Roseateles sp. DAIF2]
MLVSDHLDLMPEFQREMFGWIRAGQVQLRDTVVDGLAQAPQAFIGLFKGANAGKMLVRIQ